ncbi:MAG: cob(I)yrinic acid a,c-diamide adenosyltransferase [Patescibacteria group bacterium]|nr:cob(I)yrinic acid a,c-diamide adenosyltransferase [Patescibacteria group bacterium]
MAKKPGGLTIVYTGQGKGKTTAALGLALRAAAYNKKVAMVQFVKSAKESGEMKIAQRLKPRFIIRALGRGYVGIQKDTQPLSAHQKAARAAFREARHWLKRCDVLILDEINGAVAGKLIPLNKVIDLIKHKPSSLTLVLTGRRAHPRVIKMADLVTEMKEIKHPFRKGILAQPGIDY